MCTLSAVKTLSLKAFAFLVQGSKIEFIIAMCLPELVSSAGSYSWA